MEYLRSAEAHFQQSTPVFQWHIVVPNASLSLLKGWLIIRKTFSNYVSAAENCSAD